MYKYSLFAKAQIAQLSSYRFELMWGWVYRVLAAAVYIALWSLTANNDTDTHRLISYFFLYHVMLNPLSTGKLARWISKRIHTGEVNNYLVKPISFPAVQFTRLIGTYIARLTVPMLLLIILSLARPDIFAPASATHLFIFIVFVILSVVLWQVFMLTLGSIAFWGTEIDHFEVVIHLILSIFKGAFVPVYFFPEVLSQILTVTPIPYLASFGIEVYQGQKGPTETLIGLAVTLTWICIAFVLFRFTYRRGLQNYDALGG